MIFFKFLFCHFQFSWYCWQWRSAWLLSALTSFLTRRTTGQTLKNIWPEPHGKKYFVFLTSVPVSDGSGHLSWLLAPQLATSTSTRSTISSLKQSTHIDPQENIFELVEITIMTRSRRRRKGGRAYWGFRIWGGRRKGERKGKGKGSWGSWEQQRT